MAEHNIIVIYNYEISKIDSSRVFFTDGTYLACNVPVWATGAAVQAVTGESDLTTLDGYFGVNDFLQSTSHSNVFAGGDCTTMENYSDNGFPPKAAVREGLIIAKNVTRYLKGEELLAYVPQKKFLSLLMTGDKKAIGTKFGMAWSGKWVWKMKDYIDMSFIKLFQPQYLYRDYATLGTQFPIENNEEINKD